MLTSNQSLWERAVLFRDAALPRPDGPLEGRPYANYFLAPNYKINEMTAAGLLSQLERLDGYIERKIEAAHTIIGGVSDLGVLTPQRVRARDRHTYWVLSFTLDTERRFSRDHNLIARPAIERQSNGGLRTVIPRRIDIIDTSV